MGFSRQEHWSELPFPPPGDLPNPGIEPESPVFPALQADGLPLSHQGGLCKWKTGVKTVLTRPGMVWQALPSSGSGGMSAPGAWETELGRHHTHTERSGACQGLRT